MAQIKVDYLDHMGTDETVVNAARVSFDKEASLYSKEQNDKLISYLARNKHISPFGHCFASFRVRAPLFVARQLVKHQYLRWNEISRRYVDDAPELYVPDVWRSKAVDKKQGSTDLPVQTYESLWEFKDIPEDVYAQNEETLSLYKHLIEQGVCPEQARMILPQSMMTEWYWSGSLDAFADMCSLRLKEDTQYESRLVAQQIDEKMKELFPVSWGELVKKEEENA